MIRASHPLRFLAVVIGGWVGVRAAMLWPAARIPDLVHAVAPPAAAAIPSAVAAVAPVMRRPAFARAAGRRRASVFAAPPQAGDLVVAAAQRVDPPVITPVPTGSPRPIPASWFVAGVDPPPLFRASRWSASAWAILRPDGQATPFASQLGGSQAGGRVAYAIDGARRVALYVRASTAIDAVEREAAVGVDWRPTRLPIHIIAERRIGIEGVRGGTAIGVIGGVGPTPVAGPVRMEGYAQAGMIVRERAEGFADGSLRFTLPLPRRFDLGVGAWGGAQRGAARVDVGPTVGLVVPVAGRGVRLTADWRQRLAGDARPGSGPAMSLGVDF